jgi:hypothetical protein
MVLIRPRLNDFYILPLTQEEVDFAIPFLDEDIPLCVDPFLLWKSPSLQDNSLHTAVTNSFNHLGHLYNKGKEKDAINILMKASECYEVGLGDSRTRIGKPFGKKLANNILSLFKDIPQIYKSGFTHFEEIQLLVDNVSRDRVSDIACTFIKSFLIDFTIEQCEKYDIPLERTKLDTVYDYKKNKFVEEEVYLPQNPEKKLPIILVPKRWLRYLPWINYEDYFDNYFVKDIIIDSDKIPDRVTLLNYNRYNYDVVQTYVKIKERQRTDCKNDPLFKPIPVLSTKRKLSTIMKLPTGKSENADRKYEDNVCQLMASLVYPQLDFADIQSRTDSGVLIRDLIFYNSRAYDFLKEIYDECDCRQIVMELKNVKEIEREHVNQLNRYLKEQFGRFGIIITRNPPLRKIFKNTIDLWSGQRKCILILCDDDLKMMCQVYESKQRLPIDVIKKKYIEFSRACPS